LTRFKPSFANVPNFEGNLEFWAEYLNIVPISTPEQYSRLLEVSATLNSPKPNLDLTGKRSFFFKPWRNSTLADPGALKSKKSKNMIETDSVIDMQPLKTPRQRDSNPAPPSAAAVASLTSSSSSDTTIVDIIQNDDNLPAEN